MPFLLVLVGVLLPSNDDDDDGASGNVLTLPAAFTAMSAVIPSVSIACSGGGSVVVAVGTSVAAVTNLSVAASLFTHHCV
jgi:hypothetical protein